MTDQGGGPAPPPDLTVPPTILAPALAFAGGRVILAPFQVLLTGADQLRVLINNLVAGATVTVSGLVRREDDTLEPFSASYVPASNGTQSTFFLPIGPGFLLFLSATAPGGSAFEGATYVALQIVRGASTTPTLLTTLIQGYVSSTSFRSWPGSLVQGPQEGPGQLVTMTLPNPAPGVDFTLQVPANQLWRLVALQGQLVTSANAGQRTPRLQMATGGNNFAFITQTVSIEASSNSRFTWMVGGQVFNPWWAGTERVITVANPAAGAEWSLSVPVAFSWQVLSVFCTLTASSAAGSRQPLLRYTGGGSTYMESALQGTIGPSATGDCEWAPGLGVSSNVTATRLSSGLPIGLRLGQSDTIGTATVGIAAGDQYASIAVRVREANTPLASGTAPLPDGLDLPAGSVIQGATDGLLAGDQWQLLVATVIKHVIP